MYKLKKPCRDCPFLKDSIMRHSLSPGRLASIVDDLLESDTNTFSCHKTIDYSKQDENGELIRGPQEEFCFGSMVYLQKEGRPHVSQRIGYVTNMLDFDSIISQYDIVVDPSDVEADRVMEASYVAKKAEKWQERKV